jgi:GTPase
MQKECPIGSCEYKRQLIDIEPDRLHELITQAIFRLEEGNGTATYILGVEDDGTKTGINRIQLDQSKATLEKIAQNANAIISKYLEHSVENGKDSEKRFICIATLISNDSFRVMTDIRIAVAGNVDAGKSTTIGVLVSGSLDNGRGKSRMVTFNHRHEMESGRTSAISHHIIGFDINGNPVGRDSQRALTWPEIVERSHHVITFCDLAGHEKYLRTTLHGFSSAKPDYAMVLIGANAGITKMTREHMGICVLLDIPFFIVLTKIDLAPVHIKEEIIVNLKKLLRGTGLSKRTYILKEEKDIIPLMDGMTSNSIVPIIETSNVTGEGISILTKLLGCIQKLSSSKSDQSEPVEYHIDGNYSVTGVGTVVSGVLASGTVKVNDFLLLGPCALGNFKKVQIRSIHCKRMPVVEAHAGEYVCFAIKKLPRKEVKKGMVLLAESHPTRSTWDFQAEIEVVHAHHTTMRFNYQAVIHMNNIRQSITFVNFIKKDNVRNNENITIKDKDKNIDNSNILRSRDRAIATLRFTHRPGFVKKGFKFIFREGNVRGVGTVI